MLFLADMAKAVRTAPWLYGEEPLHVKREGLDGLDVTKRHEV